jgi:hypothetical protein
MHLMKIRLSIYEQASCSQKIMSGKFSHASNEEIVLNIN